MNFRDVLYIGLFLITISLTGMIFGSDRLTCQVVFIIGIIITGYAYAKIPASEKTPINHEQMNKNIQILNDALWGPEKKKEDTITLNPEQYWKLYVRDLCRDRIPIGDTGRYYCCCGGYCAFTKCPLRNKK